MNYTEWVTVVFVNVKGNREEVVCDSIASAKIEQEKLKAVGFYSWIEIMSYIPNSIQSRICEQIGDLF